MAEKKIPNMRQVMLPTPPEAQVFWPGGQAPQEYPYPGPNVQIDPGEMIRQFYARGIKPYTDPINQGIDNAGLIGGLGGVLQSEGKMVQSLADTFINNPAAQLEQWLPLGTVGDFGARLQSGLTGQPMPQAAPETTLPPPAPPPPTTPGFNPMAMPSISGPYVPFGYNSTEVPAYPAGPDYAAAAPVAPTQDPRAMQAAIMQGLYGGGANTDTLASPSQLMFNLGMGALKGKADYQQQDIQDKKEFNAEENAFKRWLTEQQGNETGRKAQYSLNTAEIQQRDNMTKAELGAKRAQQLQPKIDGGYAIVPTRQGDKINYNIQALPDPKMQYAAMLTTPQDLYDTILGSPGGIEALTTMSKDMNLALPAKFQAAGVSDKTIASTAIAQLVNQFAAQYPAEYAQIQQEAALRRALGAK